jgi:predicted ATPase
VELAYLKALFDKALSAAAPQFALIVGEPGIGKSRLLIELSAYADERPKPVSWRLGRCLPYGEGVTFWALSEIVKAQAGILDSDTAAAVDAKLGPVLPGGPDREWFRQRLRALLGLEAPQAGREENFAAWLGFLEQLALGAPLVLVLEDLHWADEGLLAFIEHLATHIDRVSLVLLGTARPELFEEHPTFAAGSTQLNRISLEPLTEAETERLVDSLVGEAEALGQRAADIVAHCEGNPFFAEESARLLSDQVEGALLPASIQAVVAARLDALPAAQKATLGDAAVLGDVFWNGALAALGRGGATEVDGALRALVAKHLVRRVRQSSLAGEHEFVFGHTLAREVAYGELPRAARAHKHAAAAAWIEAKAGARAEELAEVLAHHYATALDLARTLGDEELASSLEAPTIRQLAQAGERALRLDGAAAERYFTRALELAGPGSSERPRLLPRWGLAVITHSPRYREAAAAQEEAIAGLQACGEIRAAAAAMTWYALARMRFGEPSAELHRAAVDLLANDEPSAEQAWVFAGYAHGLYEA